jgi:hypothetical protein
MEEMRRFNRAGKGRKVQTAQEKWKNWNKMGDSFNLIGNASRCPILYAPQLFLTERTPRGTVGTHPRSSSAPLIRHRMKANLQSSIIGKSVYNVLSEQNSIEPDNLILRAQDRDLDRDNGRRLFSTYLHILGR